MFKATKCIISLDREAKRLREQLKAMKGTDHDEDIFEKWMAAEDLVMNFAWELVNLQTAAKRIRDRKDT